MKAKNIPNILSCIRILMTGLFVFLFFRNFPSNVIYAAAVFLLAGITDVIDGQIARKFGFITALGKILDPLADKLMQSSVLLCLAIKRIIPWWVTVLYVLKEIAMAIGALVLFKKRNAIGVSHNFGRAMVVLFYAVLLIILILGAYDGLLTDKVILILCIIAVASTLSALLFYVVSYTKKYGKKVDQVIKEKNND